ncbi:hypothetical protein [Paraburkholderia sp. HD33-4]|uniref:hypothetical protein n=1 Tax=Paraburkholderia sp. HD33-4 TaxID=2883242 RepID=UPI001F230767|nr:hypothetical protein [Paraburkholderia sp. HD33-4]
MLTVYDDDVVPLVDPVDDELLVLDVGTVDVDAAVEPELDVTAEPTAPAVV